MRLVALSIVLLAVAVLIVGWRATRPQNHGPTCPGSALGYGDTASCK